MKPELLGIDELRRCVSLLNNGVESFNQQYTASELLAICRAHRDAEWDYHPCDWTSAQVSDAIAGKVPQWGADGLPVGLK